MLAKNSGFPAGVVLILALGIGAGSNPMRMRFRDGILTFGSAAAFIAFVELAASYTPPRWAAQVEPMDALRFE